MEKIRKKELLTIVGGVSISASLLNSLARGINSLLDLGRSVGTAIRRIRGKNICPVL